MHYKRLESNKGLILEGVGGAKKVGGKLDKAEKSLESTKD
jgi:hypothetical protein